MTELRRQVYLVKQQGGTCGQACIAMIGNLSFKRAKELCGRGGGTTTSNICEFLDRIGAQHSGKLQSITKNHPLPELGIVAVKDYTAGWRNIKSNWHWIVVSRGMLYDPQGFTHRTKDLFEVEIDNKIFKNCYQNLRRVTSFIKINPSSVGL